MQPEIIFPNLGITIEHLERVCFRVLGIDIYWYAVIMCSAILVGTGYVGRLARKTGQNPDLYWDFIAIGLVSAIVGARLYYVAFSWGDYKDNLIKIFAIREGGLALYGGLIGGVLAALIFTRVKGYSFLRFVDTYMPGFALGQAIGRWGNFMNKEAFGGYADNLFAMCIRADAAAFVPAALKDRLVDIGGASYLQVHPTFLYESVWNIATCTILTLLLRRKKFDGQIIACYLVLYGLGRLWIEGLRMDQLQIGGTGIAVSQLLSGVFILIGAIFLLAMGARTKKNEGSEASEK